MVTVEEKFGRVLSDRSAELTYIVRGTDSDTTARSNLLSGSPLLHDGLKRDDAEVEEIAPNTWLGTVRYVASESAQPVGGETSFSFETRGGTQHVTQSLATVASYAAPGLPGGAPDFRGAIGVTESGVEGVDIAVPVFNFTSTFYTGSVTQGYVENLYALTGRVNSGTFTTTIDAGVTMSFAGGEVLFLGAAGSRRGAPGSDQPWELNLAFAASPNVTGLTLGDITGIAKKGWEYLWARYQAAEDTTAKVLIHKPTAAYVERVYREGDFNLLNPP
jgi:hypothetical protein